ncbi:unnamed protein product, partial [marine sediment metagenome]
ENTFHAAVTGNVDVCLLSTDKVVVVYEDDADANDIGEVIVGDRAVVVAPTVTTQAVSDIGTTTATGNGNITDNGGENCSKRGVCWNTTGNPTVGGGGPGYGISEETDSFGTGAFERPMTDLSPDTHYYVKAYAYNSAGYGYGSQVEFDTEPAVTEKEVSDTGSGVDATPAIEVALGVADTGKGTDATPSMTPTIPAIPDEGLGTDLIAAIEAAFTLAEIGEGVDKIGILYYVTFINVADIGEGADVISLDITIPAIEDSGKGVDAILGEYTKVVADQMYSSEWLGVAASMILSELAKGEDVV